MKFKKFRYSRFQPCGMGSTAQMHCVNCKQVACRGSAVILAVDDDRKIAGIVSVSAGDLVCCGKNLWAPKLFPDVQAASLFMNQAIEDGSFQAWPVVPAESRLFEQVLEMFEVTRMALQTSLENVMALEAQLAQEIMKAKVAAVPGVRLEWSDLADRSESIVMKDLEFTTAQATMRGPVKELAIDGEKAVFALPWFAKPKEPGSEEWLLQTTKGEDVQFAIWKKTTVVEDLGEGRIRLTLPSFEYMIIFTQHKSLDPALVKGL